MNKKGLGLICAIKGTPSSEHHSSDKQSANFSMSFPPFGSIILSPPVSSERLPQQCVGKVGFDKGIA